MEQIAVVNETREMVDATDRRRYELRESGEVVATLDYRTVLSGRADLYRAPPEVFADS
ncbi:hypothetical protein ACIA5C_44155 [Actinoplanes sp. NPDC051343]|uniref:hypothetical protein n=1 Tax=Actinoplanes sp. NPDC051343 TaxID=3363906 RepID=UPI0037B20E58